MHEVSCSLSLRLRRALIRPVRSRGGLPHPDTHPLNGSGPELVPRKRPELGAVENAMTALERAPGHRPPAVGSRARQVKLAVRKGLDAGPMDVRGLLGGEPGFAPGTGSPETRRAKLSRSTRNSACMCGMANAFDAANGGDLSSRRRRQVASAPERV